MSINKITPKIFLYLYCFTIFFQSMFLKVGIGNVQVSINKILLMVFAIDILAREGCRLRVPYSYPYRFTLLWLLYTMMLLPIGIIKNHQVESLKLVYSVSVYVVLFFEFTFYFRNIKDIRRALSLFNAGILVQAVIGLYEHFTLDYRFTVYKELFSTHPYFIKKGFSCAMQGNPNDFSILMVSGVFISAYFFLISVKWLSKLLCAIIVSLYSYLIYINESRSAFYFIVLGMLAFIFIKCRNKVSSRAVIFAVALIIFGILFCIHNPDKIVSVWNTFGRIRDSSDSKSTSGRMYIYLTGFKDFVNTFGLGSGYFIDALHCFWLELLFDYGIPVFVGYLFFYRRLLVGILHIRSRSDSDEVSNTALLFVVILTGFVIGSFGPASTLSIEWIGAFFAVFVAFEERCKFDLHCFC